MILSLYAMDAHVVQSLNWPDFQVSKMQDTAMGSLSNQGFIQRGATLGFPPPPPPPPPIVCKVVNFSLILNSLLVANFQPFVAPDPLVDVMIKSIYILYLTMQAIMSMSTVVMCQLVEL